ncbi:MULTISPECIES: DUF5722 domain-containing protein [unclassified Butyrivibrio]|uniref:DUF5722 domain-containing protein n=1 Tax=unclassified Butyrivibrio TaxID=2639466 RepID=UPI0003B60EA0|nr:MULTISPECIES: DUF5722 domain-containing protein [unclassified Butyrivibrio]MDC7293747.1 DUF5722 domain-containing protein [Butyrivibrio sp. DSM 10294]
MTNKAISGLLAAMAAALAIAAGVCWGGIEVQAEGNGAVSIGSATISGENVIVTAVTSDNPASDDGKYYLFAEKVYQTGPAGAPVAQAPIAPNVSFNFPLERKTVSCHLYDKFQVAVLQGGAFVPVTGSRYITNPEAVCGWSIPRKNDGKKGLILDGAKIGNGNNEAPTLGVQQAAYNINLEDVIGGNGQVVYEYNGKTYYYDSSYLSQYDHCARTCTQQGMGVTMVLLNPWRQGEEFMISPYSRAGLGKAEYYMMNTSEDQGLENLEAVVSYLAYRYNGQNGFGQVDNWVIANEVNAKNAWNHTDVSDLMTYARLYANELRVCYTAIKSRNANAYVCCSVDQNWTHTHNASYFSARSFLEAMNACICAEGNIDWALAQHPYNYPMTWTSFWTPKDAKAASMIQHNINSPYISMENIEQLTDYMCQPAMLNTKGAVRPILLTEVGYSSNQGEEAQAAAIVYAYQRAATNRYINMIVFNRQTDIETEVSQGLPVGLTRQDGSRKLAFEYYQQMNGANAGEYIQRAAAYMGIGDWAAAMNAR